MLEPGQILHVSPEHLAIVLEILQKNVPNLEVWAFGSRVAETPEEIARIKKYSDLDLAIMTREPLPLRTMGMLKEDFSDSNLPWRVDVIDWAATSESFRRIIEEKYVIVYPDR